MEIILIISLLITGLAVGLAAGILGVGGCFIMVPIQFWVLSQMGVDPTIAIRIAFGTNLAVVLPTAISGAYGHNKKGAVLWKQAVYLGAFGFCGAIGGAYVASNLPGDVLKIAFGLVILLGAARMLTAKPPHKDEKITESPVLYAVAGIILGLVSGIIGIGGGVIMIPIMVMGLKFRMHQAVGTSTAVMALIAIGGILSYVYNGWNIAGLPAYSLGYVNMLQFVLLAGTSVPMAYIGSKIAHKLSHKNLKNLFIVVMAYMGLKMIGVYSWLGLPL
ncbi:sulfite exporter TauE/SafE family protein [Methanolobus sp. ZRKC5]|uniref:sulfite exporter TauE/SafE family protein n=1 Tax=unclassified Methanolobus TaxID=2629569 RepID=UPI00313DE1BA